MSDNGDDDTDHDHEDEHAQGTQNEQELDLFATPPAIPQFVDTFQPLQQVHPLFALESHALQAYVPQIHATQAFQAPSAAAAMDDSFPDTGATAAQTGGGGGGDGMSLADTLRFAQCYVNLVRPRIPTTQGHLPTVPVCLQALFHWYEATGGPSFSLTDAFASATSLLEPSNSSGGSSSASAAASAFAPATTTTTAPSSPLPKRFPLEKLTWDHLVRMMLSLRRCKCVDVLSTDQIHRTLQLWFANSLHMPSCQDLLSIELYGQQTNMDRDARPSWNGFLAFQHAYREMEAQPAS